MYIYCLSVAVTQQKQQTVMRFSLKKYAKNALRE